MEFTKKARAYSEQIGNILCNLESLLQRSPSEMASVIGIDYDVYCSMRAGRHDFTLSEISFFEDQYDLNIINIPNPY